MKIDDFVKELFEKTKEEVVLWVEGEEEFVNLVDEHNDNEEYEFEVTSVHYSIQKKYNLVITLENDDEEEFVCLYVINKKNEIVLAYDNENLYDEHMLVNLYDLIVGDYYDDEEILDNIINDL